MRAVLTKRRLESFEIQVTSLEEATAEILSPVVDMICDTLPDLAQALNKLVVALELDAEQVSSRDFIFKRFYAFYIFLTVFLCLQENKNYFKKREETGIYGCDSLSGCTVVSGPADSTTCAGAPPSSPGLWFGGAEGSCTNC